MNRELKVVTHNGPFHADEVFACAALSMWAYSQGISISITRTRDDDLIQEADVAIDVGGIYDNESMRYDNNPQGEAGERENGIPYASFGLIWKHFGEALCGSKDLAKRIDKKLVEPIDALDSGIEIRADRSDGLTDFGISYLIASFVPSWNEYKSFDDSFNEMLEFAKWVLARQIERGRSTMMGEQLTLEAYQESNDKRIIILNDSYPWQEVLTKFKEPLFVIRPRQEDSSWSIQAVPISPYSFINRIRFPEYWVGLTTKELQGLSGVRDAMFVHNGRFFAVVASLEGARELALKAIKENS